MTACQDEDDVRYRWTTLMTVVCSIGLNTNALYDGALAELLIAKVYVCGVQFIKS